MYKGYEYDPQKLLAFWSRGKLTLREAFELALKNQVWFDQHRKLNDRDIIRQQQFIEEIFQTLSAYDLRIKTLERKNSDDYHKGNGVKMT